MNERKNAIDLRPTANVLSLLGNNYTDSGPWHQTMGKRLTSAVCEAQSPPPPPTPICKLSEHHVFDPPGSQSVPQFTIDTFARYLVVNKDV